jgi:hypothetical protein
MTSDQIIAVGLLTANDVQALGPTFSRIWPVEDTGCFNSLLQAIDDADRQIRQGNDNAPPIAGGGRY